MKPVEYQNILAVDHLEKGYNYISSKGEKVSCPVLENISFQIEPKEFVGIMGRSGCGKTTIVGKLKKYYDGLNILTDFTREFETNIGREIKEMSKAGVLDPVLKTYLFAADRYIRTKIYEEDYNSKIILFDRYYQSALAYRMAENIDKNWVKNINRIFREPDMIFYIDITPQESIRRNTDTKFNIIETEEYLQKVRNRSG